MEVNDPSTQVLGIYIFANNYPCIYVVHCASTTNAVNTCNVLALSWMAAPLTPALHDLLHRRRSESLVSRAQALKVSDQSISIFPVISSVRLAPACIRWPGSSGHGRSSIKLRLET
jgi:hypothetical protein